MLNFKKILLIVLILGVLYSNVKAQVAGVERESREAEILRRRQKLDEEFNKRQRQLDEVRNGTIGGGIYTSRPVRRTPSLSREERARIRAIIAPNAEDTAKYQNFLKQKNTGLFRLFPDFDCESKNEIRADGDCANLVPGSWAYSFRRKNYSDADFLDIQFKDGNFISKGLLSQGILVRLGDVSLESVSPTSAGVKFLLDFMPENQIGEAKKQFTQITRGIEAPDGYKYTNSLKADENTTYALRIVAYRSKISNRGLSEKITADDLKFINLNYADKRRDLTVAFRVVRRDEDGSVTILWKEINRKDSPQIIFGKKDKFLDIKPSDK
jgi:hypothetical protein